MLVRSSRRLFVRSLTPSLALFACLALIAVAVPGCESMSPAQAERVRAALTASQERVDRLEQALDDAREFAASLDQRVAEAVAERNAARDQIEDLELQIADAVAAGRTDEIRELRQQIADLRPAAESRGLDELRESTAKVTEFIAAKETELEGVLLAVRQLDASLVSPSGEVDWGGAISAAAPAASAIPGYGTAIASILVALGAVVDGRRKRQQRDSAVATAQRVVVGARDAVLSIDKAREEHRSSWESLAPSIRATQTREAREFVNYAKGKNTDRELDELIARSSRTTR